MSLKVVAADGTTQTSDVIEAIDWAIANRRELNLRIVNLAYATTEFAGQAVDPLEAAVARAAHAGMVVVVAAGNHGSDGPLPVPRRRRSPWSSARPRPTAPWPTSPTAVTSPAVPTCSRPGRSIVSVVAAGSTPMVENPMSVVDGTFIKATGTSQASAVVSGAAALLLDADSRLNPLAVRQILTASLAAPTATNGLNSPARMGLGQWSGTEWSGTEWSGTEWSGHGVVRHGVVRHGVVRHGVVRHGVVRHGVVRHGVVRHGVVRHGVVRHRVVRHGVVRHGVVRHGVVRRGVVRRRSGPARSGPARSGPARSGPARSGPESSGAEFGRKTSGRPALSLKYYEA